MKRPWGSMDPNSQHQLWSRWIFTIKDLRGSRAPSRTLEDVTEHAQKWLSAGFGKDIGRAKVDEVILGKVMNPIPGWVITAELEGVPAHDPEYVAAVRRDFRERFVVGGFGPLTEITVEVKILAGDRQDGRPPDQLVVMPGLEDEAGRVL